LSISCSRFSDVPWRGHWIRHFSGYGICCSPRGRLWRTSNNSRNLDVLCNTRYPEAGQVLLVVVFQLAIAVGSALGGVVVRQGSIAVTCVVAADTSVLLKTNPFGPRRNDVQTVPVSDKSPSHSPKHFGQRKASSRVDCWLLFSRTQWMDSRALRNEQVGCPIACGFLH